MHTDADRYLNYSVPLSNGKYCTVMKVNVQQIFQLL